MNIHSLRCLNISTVNVIADDNVLENLVANAISSTQSLSTTLVTIVDQGSGFEERKWELPGTYFILP